MAVPLQERFYQRWPTNVSSRIYTSAHIMSTGLLHICKPKSCSHPENGKVIVIFFTLMLFPVNLWIFELKKNISIPIGWSYFVGWLVFALYVTCGLLCYFNHEHFWGLIISHPSGSVSCISASVQDSLNEQMVSKTFVNQEEDLESEQEKALL
ncbi:hypothetical protein MC885_010847 [Smutsia gigantea]|nr:hypothetical protein MC885_010847 [Smutsia gigantea]